MTILGQGRPSVWDLNHGYVNEEQYITIKTDWVQNQPTDHHLNSGSYMSAPVLLNLWKELEI